ASATSVSTSSPTRAGSAQARRSGSSAPKGTGTWSSRSRRERTRAGPDQQSRAWGAAKRQRRRGTPRPKRGRNQRNSTGRGAGRSCLLLRATETTPTGRRLTSSCASGIDPYAFSTLLLDLVVIFLLILSWASPVRLWVEAVFAGVRVGIGELVGMRLRKVSP